MAKRGGNLDSSVQKEVLQNLIELQKVHTALAEKFNKLSEQLSNLLALFEMAARSFSKNPANISGDKDKEFLDKIDRLLEQNKTIARGLTLIEGKVRERVYGSTPQAPQENTQTQVEERPLPKFQ